MSKVPVLDTKKRVLEPCHPAVARRLLREEKAAVYKRYPFTIILKLEVPESQTGDYTLSIDPGSKCTGMAITDSENTVVAFFELHHRKSIKKALSDRSGHRRSRRTRNCRHRAPRFDNRSRQSPRLVNGQWIYEKVKNTRKTENTFHRVSDAMLKDKRYEWTRLRPSPAKHREKTRLYYANGKRMRTGDIYYEKGGKYYRYNSNNEAHKQYKKRYPKKVYTYSPKKHSVKKRWRRVLKREYSNAQKRNRREEPQLYFSFIEKEENPDNGWVAPSLMSRIYNIATWVNRLSKLYPIKKLAVEHVKFDMQLMDNSKISGEEYQQGKLQGYEIREYLLEKFGRKCYYCKEKNVPLEIEHIIPKAKGGTNRVDNLTLSCGPCNTKKGNLHPDEINEEEHGKDFAERVKKASAAAKKPLKDAAAVNTIRWKIVETLKATGLEVFCGTGGKTKYHRSQAGLPKTHYYDAACVAGVVKLPNMPLSVLGIHAVGYGHRRDLGNCQTKQTAPGFKRPYTRVEHAGGFQKLDMVEMLTHKGKVVGHINSFDKTSEGKPQKLRVKKSWDGDDRVGGNIKQLRKIQKRDGYAYQIATCIPTAPDSRQKVKNPLIS